MMNIIVWVILPLLAVGIMMFFFARAGSVMARRRIARLLQPGETVLRKAETLGRKLPRRFSLLSVPSFLVPLPWQGTLYLTIKGLFGGGICSRILGRRCWRCRWAA